MSSQRLDALRRQFTEAKTGAEQIEANAAARGDDLTSTEQADVDTLLKRCEDLAPEIELLAGQVGRVDSTAKILQRIAPSSGPTPAPASSTTLVLPSAGEFASLVVRAKLFALGDGRGDPEAAELLKRAVATQITTDTPGIIPVPIIGPVLKLADIRRPVFASMTPRPMPAAGKTFSRPQVTQRTLVGVQAAELDELSSRKMTIAGNTVTKMTLGGVLELSEQDIDWTDPGVLQIVIDDFVDTYTEATEARAIVALNALAAATSDWDPTSIASRITSFTTAINAVYTTAKRMPDTVWLALDSMLALAGTSNTTTNVTAMTLIKQALNDAGVPMRFITAPGLASGKIIVGCSSLVEAYEQQKGILSAPDVSHLGVNIAYRGYAAFFGLAAGFVSLVDA